MLPVDRKLVALMLDVYGPAAVIAAIRDELSQRLRTKPGKESRYALALEALDACHKVFSHS